MRIYLAGFIQGAVIDKCIAWRREIKSSFDSEYYRIIWRDPLDNRNPATISQDGLTSENSPNAIFHRDYQLVTTSDLVIANMDTFGQVRPPIGTICELALTWEKKIPIIIITKDKNYRHHPFISYFTSEYVESVKELLDKRLIEYFYNGLHPA